MALETEVFGSGDEAGAEEGGPDAIDGDAGGEWVVRVGEPLGETEPVGCGVVRERKENGRDAGLDGIAGLAEVAAVEDGSGAARAFGFAHDHDLGEGDGEVVFGASGFG